MRTVKINDVKVRIFEDKDLIEKLRLTKEEFDLVKTYQKLFPELLQDGIEGFVIDAENLWNQLGQPQGQFNKWTQRKIKDVFENGVDWTFGQVSPKGGRPKQVIKLTLETAKQVSMFTGIDKNSSEDVKNTGKLVRMYFITMEKTLRKNIEWIQTREPEKEGNKKLCDTLDKDYKSIHNVLHSPSKIFMDENDMLNLALLGMRAKQVRNILDCKDKNTREHFDTSINKALSELQLIDDSLIIGKVDYDLRKNIIEATCREKYSDLKLEWIEFLKFIKEKKVS